MFLEGGGNVLNINIIKSFLVIKLLLRRLLHGVFPVFSNLTTAEKNCLLFIVYADYSKKRWQVFWTCHPVFSPLRFDYSPRLPELSPPESELPPLLEGFFISVRSMVVSPFFSALTAAA